MDKFYFIIITIFGDSILLCSAGQPGTHDGPASAPVQGSQAHTTMMVSSELLRPCWMCSPVDITATAELDSD
jgi:hypothetical protein